MIKVACILDEFSYECFKYEASLIQLGENDWYAKITRFKPDFLFVESAWRGLNGKWMNKIGGLENVDNSLLKRVIDLCHHMNIPTVFWNKEDPVHFKYFIEAAKLFDFVFTTDADMIPKYKEQVHHDRVYPLLFAVQPKIHNPIGRNCTKLGNIAFAGTWYSDIHPIRRKNMEIVLNPALKYGIHIYDRMYRYRNYSDYRYPDMYRENIIGYIRYKNMPKIYKSYNIFMNVNDVNFSSSMFSRRVFELLACGTNVISSYSRGIEKIFPNIVQLSNSEGETQKCIDTLIANKVLRDRLSLMGQREVFLKHTYRNRLETILETIGINYEKNNNDSVTFISLVCNPAQVKNVLRNFKRQENINKELIVLIKRSDEIKMQIEKLSAEEPFENKIYFIEVDDIKNITVHIGESIDRAAGNYLCFINPEDHYSRYFTIDIINAFKYADADIIGKNTYYRIIRTNFRKELLGDKIENTYVRKLNLFTSVFKKEIFNNIQFSDIYSNPNRFLEQCNRRKIIMYSTDSSGYFSTEENDDIEASEEKGNGSIGYELEGEEDFIETEQNCSCGCTGPEPPCNLCCDDLTFIFLLFILLRRCNKNNHNKDTIDNENPKPDEKGECEDVDDDNNESLHDCEERRRKHHKKFRKH